MMYDPSMMVSALLRKFCEKDSHLNYTPAEYAFTMDSKDEVLPLSQPCMRAGQCEIG
jgi:hypothetical protein